MVIRGCTSALLIIGCAWPVANFFGEPRLAGILLALAAAMFISAVENIGVWISNGTWHSRRSSACTWPRGYSALLPVSPLPMFGEAIGRWWSDPHDTQHRNGVHLSHA